MGPIPNYVHEYIVFQSSFKREIKNDWRVGFLSESDKLQKNSSPNDASMTWCNLVFVRMSPLVSFKAKYIWHQAIMWRLPFEKDCLELHYIVEPNPNLKSLPVDCLWIKIESANLIHAVFKFNLELTHFSRSLSINRKTYIWLALFKAITLPF